MTETVTLADAFPIEQARCRKVLGHFKEIGPAGAFGAACIEFILQKADQAVSSGDVIAMLRSFEEMKTVQD